MSFPRHEGIFRSDGLGLGRSGAQSERLHAPTHRLDEFPTGYSSAGWSPPEPVSASPAEQKFTMKAAPQPSLFQRMGKPCLTGCLTAGVHRMIVVGLQPVVALEFVGEQLGTSLYVATNKPLELFFSAFRHNRGTDFAAPFKDASDDGLINRTASMDLLAAFLLVHVAGLAANEGLISLYLSGKFIK